MATSMRLQGPWLAPLIGLLLLCAFAFLATAEDSGESSGDSLEIDGRIISVASDEVALFTGEQQYMIMVDAHTRIMLDGAEATLDRLTPGDLAGVEAQRSGEKWLAKSIDATSHKPVHK